MRLPEQPAEPDKAVAEVEAQMKVTAPLSNEIDEFDHPFVLSSDGTTTFGKIDAESGLTEAPIKLNVGENYVGEDGANHGYGIMHIDAEQ